MTLTACRHRGDEVAPGVRHCHSPKLVGLKLVTEPMCGGCVYRDHGPDAAPPVGPARLLPCLRRGRRLDAAGHECLHPAHARATDARCRDCPDYLFPVVTPQTPPRLVQQILDLPPRPQPPGWWGWPNVQEALRRGADEVVTNPPPAPDEFRGRGVVIVGGGKYFPSAYVTVRVLRHVGCQLPIQLWHLTGEMTPSMRDILSPFGVTCVDADALAETRPFRFLHGHRWKGWQLKPYAVAHSPFREVLLLDADCYPTRDPAFLFDWPPYRDRGAIFWPDLESSAYLLPDRAWEAFGVAAGWPPLESGQLVIDKQTCWRELQLALWYNARADLVYNLVWGDKDTFNVAWRRLGTEYARPAPRSDYDTHTILQYAPDGGVLFQHRCQDKFRLTGDHYTGCSQLDTANRHNPRLAHEDLCFGFIEELRRCWDAAEREGLP